MTALVNGTISIKNVIIQCDAPIESFKKKLRIHGREVCDVRRQTYCAHSVQQCCPLKVVRNLKKPYRYSEIRGVIYF